MILSDRELTLEISYKDIKETSKSKIPHWKSKVSFTKKIVFNQFGSHDYFYFDQTPEEIEKMIKIEKFNESFEDKLK